MPWAGQIAAWPAKAAAGANDVAKPVSLGPGLVPDLRPGVQIMRKVWAGAEAGLHGFRTGMVPLLGKGCQKG